MEETGVLENLTLLSLVLPDFEPGLFSVRFGWPATSSLNGSARKFLQLLRERLLTECPIGTTNQGGFAVSYLVLGFSGWNRIGQETKNQA